MAAHYADAVRLLSAAPLAGYLPALWLNLTRCKRNHYESVSRYNLAMALLMATTADGGGTLDREARLLINSHSRVAETGSRKAMYSETTVGTTSGRTMLGN